MLKKTHTQQQFLNDVKTRINMYLYRSLEVSFDPLTLFLQDTSLIGPMNWQIPANKERLQNVFTNLSLAVSNYSMTDGDFRTYLLLKMVNIVYNEFSEELFRAFVSSAYGVDADTVVGNLDEAYSIQPSQNTQFPGLSTNTNPMAPLPQKLVPNILYASASLDKPNFFEQAKIDIEDIKPF